jgi:TPR repeat protein
MLLCMKRTFLLIALVFGGAAAILVASWSISYDATPQAAPTSPPATLQDLPTLMGRAEKGDAIAEFQLGEACARGLGITNNYAQAAIWYRRAADQGNAAAQASLGELYEAGQGVEKDVNEAIRLYRTAAEHGSARAQYNLAFLYESGRGLPQDQARALHWYKLAAEQGNPIAQYDLGQRYDLGVGVTVDRVEAFKWLLLAAQNGQTDAATRLVLVKKNLTRAEISEAKRRAATFSATRPSFPPRPNDPKPNLP